MDSDATDTDALPRRRFPLWVGLALSVATVGPTLAMAESLRVGPDDWALHWPPR